MLLRDNRIEPAKPELANGRVAKLPLWDRRKAYSPGEYVQVDLIEGLGARSLQAMANGPIMEPLRLFLPAGKLSEEEYRQRVLFDYEQAGIGADERSGLPLKTRRPQADGG